MADEYRQAGKACTIGATKPGEVHTPRSTAWWKSATRVRVSKAEAMVEHRRVMLERARERLPEDDQAEIRERLAEHATDEWLYRCGPADPGRRKVV